MGVWQEALTIDVGAVGCAGFRNNATFGVRAPQQRDIR